MFVIICYFNFILIRAHLNINFAYSKAKNKIYLVFCLSYVIYDVYTLKRIKNKEKLRMSDTVTRMHLSNIVHEKIGASVVEASKIVDAVFEEIALALKSEEIMKVAFFGSFYVRSKKQRIGRNPKTKVEAVITPRKTISFYASNELKAQVNK
jgi:integration host factor subunit alpha